MDEKVIKDLEYHIANAKALKIWLDNIYYDPDFATLFNRPVISMMSTGADYLKENLQLLKQKYQLRKA